MRSFDVDEERARTASRRKWKNGPCAPLRVLSVEKFSKSLANWSIFAAPGIPHYCSAGIFWVDLDRDVPEEEFAGVEWCSDAYVSLLEELKIVFFLYAAQDRVEKIVIGPQKKPTSLGTATQHVSTFSPFLYLPLVL